MTREEFKDQVTKILWFESADQAAEAAGALWDEVRSAGWKAGPTVAVPEAFRRAIEADTAVMEATSGVTDWYRGVQAPEAKRLTVRQLGALAGCSASEGPEQWRGALRTAVALGYKIVPDEVELPARIRIVVAGAADGETGRLLTDRERRAAEAWWEQRPTLVIIAQALASLTVAEGAEGRMALIQEDLDKALAAPARAARGKE